MGDSDYEDYFEEAEYVLMVSIFDYVPINTDELAVKAYEQVKVTQSSLSDLTDFVWATKVESQVNGFIPRMLLRKEGTNEALFGFMNWTWQEANRNLKPNTFVIRNSSGKCENQPLSVSIWKPGFEKCIHQEIVAIEQNGKTVYPVYNRLVDSLQQVVDGIVGSKGKVQPLICQPPVTPLRDIGVDEADNLKTRNLGEGQFGEVYEAVKMRSDGIEIKFAVKKAKIKLTGSVNAKTLKAKRDMEQEIGIMQYIAFMKNKLDFHTETLVKLLFAPEGFQVAFIELCPLGDAKKLAHTIMDDNNGRILMPEILEFAIQLMEACKFLSEIRVSHNDWACRNILVTSGGNTRKYLYKVGDFGLATYVNEGNEKSNPIVLHLTSKLKRFEELSNSRLPFRWMPPEFTSPNLKDCDENCNMWSCCVTIMEFASGATEKPWPDYDRARHATPYYYDDYPLQETNTIGNFRNFLAKMHNDPGECDEYEYNPKPEFMSYELFKILKKGIKHKIYRAKPSEMLRVLKALTCSELISSRRRMLNFSFM